MKYCIEGNFQMVQIFTYFEHVQRVQKLDHTQALYLMVLTVDHTHIEFNLKEKECLYSRNSQVTSWKFHLNGEPVPNSIKVPVVLVKLLAW